LAARGVGDISILKVDTEGSEIPILTDLGDRLDRTDFVYLEYHSDNDRRELDSLLTPHFILAAAKAHIPHRGTLTYISRRIIARWPELLNTHEIKR
jgi:hypothetical protein